MRWRNNFLRPQQLQVRKESSEHDLLQRLFRHLAVADHDAGVRDQPLEMVGDMSDAFYPIVHEVDLTVSVHLP